MERALRIHDTVFRHLLVVHQGPMPEPDGDIVEVAPEEAPTETPADGEPAPVVGAASAGAADDAVEDEELAEAPSASDDEGDE